jgi:hypothetical protein
MEVTPFISVGSLRFGATREDIRAQLGARFESFKKSPNSNETDAYDELGLHLYYDRDNRLEYVEAFEPAEPEYAGIVFVGRAFEDVRNDLTEAGYACSFMDAASVKCDDAGIALYISDGIVEGAGVYRRGYFDS